MRSVTATSFGCWRVAVLLCWQILHTLKCRKWQIFTKNHENAVIIACRLIVATFHISKGLQNSSGYTATHRFVVVAFWVRFFFLLFHLACPLALWLSCCFVQLQQFRQGLLSSSL